MLSRSVPITIGTMGGTSPKTICKKGNCTSRQCSPSCAASLQKVKAPFPSLISFLPSEMSIGTFPRGVSAKEYTVSTLAPANPALWLGPSKKILLYLCPGGILLYAEAATSPLNTYPAWGTIIALGGRQGIVFGRMKPSSQHGSDFFR